MQNETIKWIYTCTNIY